MITFPKISLPSYPFKEKIEDNSIRSKFEDGSMQSRRKYTRSRDTFTVTWNRLPDKEYRILKHFVKNVVFYSAESFLWEYPKFDDKRDMFRLDNDILNKRMLEVRIINFQDAQCDTLDYWNVTLELQEV